MIARDEDTRDMTPTPIRDQEIYWHAIWRQGMRREEALRSVEPKPVIS